MFRVIQFINFNYVLKNKNIKIILIKTIFFQLRNMLNTKEVPHLSRYYTYERSFIMDDVRFYISILYLFPSFYLFSLFLYLKGFLILQSMCFHFWRYLKSNQFLRNYVCFSKQQLSNVKAFRSFDSFVDQLYLSPTYFSSLEILGKRNFKHHIAMVKNAFFIVAL